MKEDPPSVIKAIEEAFQFYATKGDSKIAASQVARKLNTETSQLAEESDRARGESLFNKGFNATMVLAMK
ncbi:hypothetical protein GCK32_019830 [Trichostrongylus colubriformis]|uniref:Uncharacterized protein n=1 Tax=Trichostrongylus colubriformis TaxID=6319 RepID=A0AAN8IYX3_TRICO